MITLHHADCRDALRNIADNSLDSCVTDPPYHLLSTVKRFANSVRTESTMSKVDVYRRSSVGFMGKSWDGGDIAFTPELWTEVYRVLKPGAFVAAFGASRGYHRMACAIEDAGFEIRDSVMYLYGTGFPKSHNLDNKRGDLICGCDSESPSECDVRPVLDSDVSAQVPHGEVQRQVLQSQVSESSVSIDGTQAATGGIPTSVRLDQPVLEGRSLSSGTQGQLRVDEVRPLPADSIANGTTRRLRDGASDGHGAALSLSSDADGMRASLGPRLSQQRSDEPGTVAGQSQSQDGGAWEDCGRCGKPMVVRGLGSSLKPAFEPIVLARKPLSEGTVAANVLRWRTGALNIDGCRIAAPGETISNHGETGISEPTSFSLGARVAMQTAGQAIGRWPANVVHDGSDEVVGAFPSTKSGQLLPTHNAKESENGSMSGKNYAGRIKSEFGGDSGSAARFFYSAKASKADRAGSKHPTVKPIALMQWLARLITPPGGTVLDPFAGSGTTGAACVAEGFRCVLIEREDEYVRDIERRLGIGVAEGAPRLADLIQRHERASALAREIQARLAA